jgi:DNA-binding transcriptional ArsR family regulator
MNIVPNAATAPPPLDATLTALADPTRRAILRRLGSGEARVTELAAPFPISLNSVSKHIRMLERAGLVRRRRAGREHFLSFDPRPLDATARWIEEQRAAWTARLQALDALLQEEDRSQASHRAAATKKTTIKKKGRSR